LVYGIWFAVSEEAPVPPEEMGSAVAKAMVPVAVRPATDRLPLTSAFPWTERSVAGEVVPMPTFPAPSITSRSAVPTTEEEEILNLPKSATSVPMVQLVSAGVLPATVLEAEKTI
jgi:hypothetical protein